MLNSTQKIYKRNKNFVMLFVGQTGSGKSYSALRLAEMLDDTFDINRVKFKAKDFMNTINKLVEKSEQGEEIKGNRNKEAPSEVGYFG